jgi:rod shape determining protein RodA
VLPVVGVTLPLFSYGGSSVMTILIGLGLLMNVSMRRPNMTPVRSGQILLAR